MKRMTKCLALILCLALLATMAACNISFGTGNDDSSSSAPVEETPQQVEEQAEQPRATDAPATTDNTVYFKDNLNWSNGGTKSIYVYYWKDGVYDMVAWPGKAMNKSSDGTYSYTLPDDVTFIIFNNNGDKDTQTRDIPYDGSAKQFTASSKTDDIGCHYVTDWNGADINSNAVGDGTKIGQGNNDNLVLSMTLFNKEYTLGKSFVKDMTANSWGKDPESWKNVDLEEKLEYKSSGPSGLEMDNNSNEITIQYKNLAETFATPENCVLSYFEYTGTLNASYRSSDFSCFGGKFKPSSYSSLDDIDTALNNLFGKYKLTEDIYSSSVSHTYEVETANGKIHIYANENNSDSTIKMTVRMRLSNEFVYTGN